MQIQDLEDKLKIAEAEIIGARVGEQVCISKISANNFNHSKLFLSLICVVIFSWNHLPFCMTKLRWKNAFKVHS